MEGGGIQNELQQKIVMHDCDVMECTIAMCHSIFQIFYVKTFPFIIAQGYEEWY